MSENRCPLFGIMLCAVCYLASPWGGRIIAMITLFHHPFCPHSRFVRLVLGEYGLESKLVEERVWERREDFLKINPDARTPVLIEEGRPAVPGAMIIAEYLDETRGTEAGERRLLPADPAARVEVRRLASWFHDRFFDEVSRLPRHRAHLQADDAHRAGRRPARHQRDPCGAPQHPLSSRLYRLARAAPHLACGRALELRRSGGGRASVGGRLSGRCAVDRGRSRKDLVRAGEVAALVPAAAGRTLGRRFRRRRPTRTSISDDRRQGGAARGRARARLRCGRRDAARRDPAGEALFRALHRRRRARRHGVARRDRRAAHRSAGVVAGGALGRDAGPELRAGPRPARDPASSARSARSRSTRRATTITT